MASLTQHREKYCRYRQGKKARQPAVARQPRNAVEVEDQYEFWGDECYAARTKVSANGRARDYEMLPCDDVVDVEHWFTAEMAAVRSVIEKLFEY